MNLPYSLINLSPWCLWEKFDRPNGKIGKRPINLHGYPIQVKNYPNGWQLHDTLVALESGKGDGLSIYLGNGLCGIDLDDCIDASGALSVTASTIMQEFASYTELSPSGGGLHILFRTDHDFEVGVKNSRTNGIEFHSGLTHFTVTGNSYHSEALPIRVLPLGEVKQFLSIYFPLKPNVTSNVHSIDTSGLTAMDILQRGQKDTRFVQLWNNADGGNQSDFDMAFCLKLAFYCGGNVELMDACFRQSSRMREKWDNKCTGQETYGQHTIAKAIAGWDGRCYQLHVTKPELHVTTELESPMPIESKIDDSQGTIKNTSNNTGGEFSTDDSVKASLPPQSTLGKSLAKRLLLRLAFDPISERWMSYDSVVWSPMNDLNALSFIDDELQARVSVGYAHGYLIGVSNFTRMKLTCFDWDTVPDVVPFQNGLLNLKTRSLIPHSHAHRTTWVIPYHYTDSTDCQGIKDWLLECVGGKADQVQLLRAYMAAIFRGHSHLQRYLELIGPGGTGKSSFITLCEMLVGASNAYSTRFDCLTGNFETALLYGKRLVVITDSRRNAGDVSILKAITGGDKIRYEEKRKQATQPFVFGGMLVIAANEHITSEDYTSGLARRRITVEFNNRVDTAKRRDLTSEFAVQLPALVNWLLDMSDDEIAHYVRDTHVSVPSLKGAARENLLSTNPLAQWLDECVIYQVGAKTPVGTLKTDNGGILDWHCKLYPSYVNYCQGSGFKNHLSAHRFVKLLYDLCTSQLGLDVERTKDMYARYFTSLKIRAQGDSGPSPLDVKYSRDGIVEST